jgi:hypothetical protein
MASFFSDTLVRLAIAGSLAASSPKIELDIDIDNSSANADPVRVASLASGELGEDGVALLVMADPISSVAAEIELEMEAVTISSISSSRTAIAHRWPKSSFDSARANRALTN